MECQSVRKPYSNIARWWEEKVFRCWKKEWRPWTQMKTKSINSWEWNRFMVSERKWCLKEEVSKRVKMMANTELNDANLIKAINWRLYRLQPTQWKSAESIMLSWRNWIRWLRKNSKERTCWDGKAGKWWTIVPEERERQKRTEVAEGCLQREKTACRLLHGQVDQLMDWSCMEKREDQRGECNLCGMGEDDGGSWSEIALFKGNRRLVCRKQWNPGESKTTRQRNSKANSTKNKKTNVISGWAKTYTAGRHPQSWRC